MTTTVLAVIAAIISGIVGPVLVLFVKQYLDDKKSEKEDLINESDLGEMVTVLEFIEEIRETYKFDRVSICQFHNGGKFLNGRSMKKFSMTYETVAPGIEKIKRKYQNVLVSEFPKLFSAMMKEPFLIINQQDEDFPALRREMQTNGIVQSVKMSIIGLRGEVLGFITCHSIGKANNLVGSYLRHELQDKANQISGYLAR